MPDNLINGAGKQVILKVITFSKNIKASAKWLTPNFFLQRILLCKILGRQKTSLKFFGLLLR